MKRDQKKKPLRRYALNTAAGLLLTALVYAGNLPATAQAPPPAEASLASRLRERPRYPSDPQRLQRTVAIDGAFNENEWDPFYTVDDGAIKGTVYCNWDKDFLYVAARTDRPAAVLLDLDLSGDGWLRGTDNLELVVGSAGNGNALDVKARALDAETDKDNPAWHEKPIDAKTLRVAEKTANGFQVVTIAIPRNTLGLTLRPGAKLGMRAEFLPPGTAEGYMPTAPYEPHILLEARLVEAQTQTMPGIVPRLSLSSKTCIPGQKLFATLDLSNRTTAAIPVKSVTWTGKGTSEKSLDPVRDTEIQPIQPNKRVKVSYKTVLPQDLPAGTYTLTAAAELQDGKQVKASMVFTVIEPLRVQIISSPQPVPVNGQTSVTISVEVTSFTFEPINAKVELVRYPDTWVLDGSRRHSVRVDERYTKSDTRYTLRLPASAANGEYPIEASVSWQGKTWRAQHTVHVKRPETPPVPK